MLRVLDECANVSANFSADPVHDLRVALRLESDIQVVPCIAHDKESVKDVVLALLEDVLELVWVEELTPVLV